MLSDKQPAGASGLGERTSGRWRRQVAVGQRGAVRGIAELGARQSAERSHSTHDARAQNSSYCVWRKPARTILSVLELVNSSHRAKNSKRRPVDQDSLSLIVSSGFITFWTGTRFALKAIRRGMTT